MDPRRLVVAFALGAALSCTVGPARADAYEVALIRAVAAKERALDVNEPERWQEALRSFREADAVRPTLETRYEIGFAAERLRQDDVAVEAYESALALGLGGTASEHARAFVTERSVAMGRLDLRGPDAATVSIGGVARGRLPLAEPLVVFAGDVELLLAFPDGRTATRTASVAAGTIARVDVTEPPPPPVPIAPVAPVAASARAPAPAPKADSGGGSDTLGWVLTGGGIALGAAGAVLVVVSSSKLDGSRSRLDDYCQVPAGSDACKHAQPGHLEDAQREVDAIATWKAVRTGSWVAVGAGVASLGAGLFFLGGGSRLVASAEPQGVRFRLLGAF